MNNIFLLPGGSLVEKTLYHKGSCPLCHPRLSPQGRTSVASDAPLWSYLQDSREKVSKEHLTGPFPCLNTSITQVSVGTGSPTL